MVRLELFHGLDKVNMSFLTQFQLSDSQFRLFDIRKFPGIRFEAEDSAFYPFSLLCHHWLSGIDFMLDLRNPILNLYRALAFTSTKLNPFILISKSLDNVLLPVFTSFLAFFFHPLYNCYNYSSKALQIATLYLLFITQQYVL